MSEESLSLNAVESISSIKLPVLRVKRDGDKYVLADGSTTSLFDKSLYKAGSYALEAAHGTRMYMMEGVYEADGVTPRLMSLGQLVMALCLARATEMEAKVVSLMDELALNTMKVNAYSMVLGKFTAANDGVQYVQNNWFEGGIPVMLDDSSQAGTAYGLKFSEEESVQLNEYSLTLFDGGLLATPYHWLQTSAGISMPSPTSIAKTPGVWTPVEVNTIVTTLTNELDKLNSISQEFLIEVQNLTSKRDNSYDMLSAILKSLSTTLMAEANNIR